ncbi:hypothetical protein ATI61_11426 [Archangium gephyra]|uniref:Uncharacterized protein n=1 Tax=Archangium gephyra TaxID=48 RepID=A0ABX9JQB5_9BACT|nr:hypothetical protein ATI61_11426 [Archangium gephyra]
MPTRDDLLREKTFKGENYPPDERVFRTLHQDPKSLQDLHQDLQDLRDPTLQRLRDLTLQHLRDLTLQADRNSKAIGILVGHLRKKNLIIDEEIDELLFQVTA